MKFPEQFEKNMKTLLGLNFEKYEKSMNLPAKRGIRVNKNYVSSTFFKSIFPFEIKNLGIAENLFELETQEKIGNSVFHHAGMIYLQEPSSMLASVALDVKNGETILDLCASPGGKTGQILEENKDGVVVSNEIVRKRANVLFSNIERQGFKNGVVTSLAPEVLSELLPNFFDKILVDAPCSGEGMFRKEPETISEWNENLPLFNHERQLKILKEADKMLKTGGTMVYSTCTFNMKEDEETVAVFADNFGYEILPLPEKVKNVMTAGKDVLGQKTSLTGKCFPFDGFGEGQFVSLLKKKSENNNTLKSSKNKVVLPNKKELEIVKNFLKETIDDVDFYFYKFGENYFISKVDLPVLPFGVVSCGVCVGEVKKDRIEPAHQFFKAYGNNFKRKINLEFDDKRVEQYLKGNEIDCNSENGFACVFVSSVPLGGGKVVQGRLKNYYPKGLRL